MLNNEYLLAAAITKSEKGVNMSRPFNDQRRLFVRLGGGASVGPYLGGPAIR